MHSRLHSHIGTLRQLEILLAVYEHDGITAASEALHLTQPTVSAQVKKLTNAIGTPLYNQVGRKLIFTDAGLATVATARKVLDQFAQLDMQLADLRGLKSGTLKLAVVTTSKYFIPHLLGPFCKRYPDVDIQLKVGNRRQILERLLEGSDDFYVISHPPEDTKLEKIELLPNPLVAISAGKHSLSQRKHISITDLCNERFLMREAGSGTRYAIEEFLRKKLGQPPTRTGREEKAPCERAEPKAASSGWGVLPGGTGVWRARPRVGMKDGRRREGRRSGEGPKR